LSFIALIPPLCYPKIQG